MQMGKIISIINNKGGVGKTTSTAFLGEILSTFGKKVLLVDLDESGNLSVLYNKYTDDSPNVLNGSVPASVPNIAELFKYRYKDKENVQKTIQSIRPNLDIISASKRHGQTPTLLFQNQLSNNNIVLKRALNAIRNDYDYILLDTAPANDILIVNSLIASDYILVPIRSEGFSYKGLKETLETISYLKEEYDIDAEFLGAFQTAVESNTSIYKSLDENYRMTLQDKYLPSIRKDVKVNELLTTFHNVIEYTASSNVLYDYCMLILSLNILDDQTCNLIRKAYV